MDEKARVPANDPTSNELPFTPETPDVPFSTDVMMSGTLDEHLDFTVMGTAESIAAVIKNLGNVKTTTKTNDD